MLICLTKPSTPELFPLVHFQQISDIWCTPRYASWRNKPVDGPKANEVSNSRRLESSSRERFKLSNMLLILKWNPWFLSMGDLPKEWKDIPEKAFQGVRLDFSGRFETKGIATTRQKKGLLCSVPVFWKKGSAPGESIWYNNCFMLCWSSKTWCPAGLPFHSIHGWWIKLHRNSSRTSNFPESSTRRRSKLSASNHCWNEQEMVLHTSWGSSFWRIMGGCHQFRQTSFATNHGEHCAQPRKII